MSRDGLDHGSKMVDMRLLTLSCLRLLNKLRGNYLLNLEMRLLNVAILKLLLKFVKKFGLMTVPMLNIAWTESK